jgi:hypothetical protein
MTKRAIILLFHCMIFQFCFSQNIVDNLLNDKIDFIARQDGVSSSYVGTIIFEDKKVKLLYESMGFTPSIMAIRIDSNLIELIIKSRWTGDEESPRDNDQYPVLYYYLGIQYKNKSVKYSCKRIENMKSFDLSSYRICKSFISDDNVNVREDSSVSAKVINKLQRNEQVEFININSNNIDINLMKDYWYRIKYKGKLGNVFGYFIDFSKDVSIK